MERLIVILTLVALGSACVVINLPIHYFWYGLGGGLWLLAGVYALLTGRRPRL